jgi:hypothetical protein
VNIRDNAPYNLTDHYITWIPVRRLFPAAALGNNALIQGGAILDHEEDHGFIRAISLEDAQGVWEKKFSAKLAFNGLAVDTCGIIASFDDGTVARLK